MSLPPIAMGRLPNTSPLFQRESFLRALALCAAFFPSSVSTIYCGLFFEAATLWPLIWVGLVCFLTTLPCAVPPLADQLTLSPVLGSGFSGGFLVMLSLAGDLEPTHRPRARSFALQAFRHA